MVETDVRKCNIYETRKRKVNKVLGKAHKIE